MLVGMIGVVGVMLLAWIGPELAGWVNRGHWVGVGFWRAQGAVLRALLGRHPTLAYPQPLRKELPRPLVFWTIQALAAIIVVAIGGAGLRELDVRVSRPVSDRRWWHPASAVDGHVNGL